MAINRKQVDRIRLGVRMRVIGINLVLHPEKTGYYLAGYSKRFWKLLYESKLVSDALTYKEIWRLPESRRGCEPYPATQRRNPWTRAVGICGRPETLSGQDETFSYPNNSAARRDHCSVAIAQIGCLSDSTGGAAVVSWDQRVCLAQAERMEYSLVAPDYARSLS